MYSKILLSTLAALGLMSAVVAPTRAYPRYSHYERHSHYQHREYRHYHVWPCRTFATYSDACSWMDYQRQCGCQCYCEWQGSQCCVYYR